ncbi:Hpt domain-containing protein [Umboniibacter marinipuniceus]|uniref:Hpt domain-containing protein n=1 Tax=Umboniibacter marinipuniceus TaxID=569599 RepID=A0A3M0A908_9GAMM|nr:Hpt domain-containing protein [Umboniibacter marinipuniceus]RMA79298.1 Hpt domain-containing protein [Umboniibacter marinipuniceus]
MAIALEINTSHFKDICCQQADIASSLLSQIRNDLPEISAALNSNNQDEILFAVHRLLGIGRYCGIGQLVVLSQQLESEGMRGTLNHAKLKELKKLSHQLSQWLDESEAWVANNFR